MSGNFSRTMYDDSSYRQSVKQSTGPMIYRLNPFRNQRCSDRLITSPGFIGTAGVSVSSKNPLVDIESKLLRLNKTNHIKVNPKSKLTHLPVGNFGTDYTRLSNPISITAREQGINRFHPLHHNPQDEKRWLHPSETNISYRSIIKDTHKAKVPKPLDQTTVLPPKKNRSINPSYASKCEKTKPIRGMHKHYRN
jgi:hypothetical protein